MLLLLRLFKSSSSEGSLAVKMPVGNFIRIYYVSVVFFKSANSNLSLVEKCGNYTISFIISCLFLQKDLSREVAWLDFVLGAYLWQCREWIFNRTKMVLENVLRVF